MGVLTRPRGFALLIREAAWRGSRYRALVPGPNVDGDLAPDVTASAPMPASDDRERLPVLDRPVPQRLTAGRTRTADPTEPLTRPRAAPTPEVAAGLRRAVERDAAGRACRRSLRRIGRWACGAAGLANWHLLRVPIGRRSEARLRPRAGPAIAPNEAPHSVPPGRIGSVLRPARRRRECHLAAGRRRSASSREVRVRVGVVSGFGPSGTRCRCQLGARHQRASGRHRCVAQGHGRLGA